MFVVFSFSLPFSVSRALSHLDLNLSGTVVARTKTACVPRPCLTALRQLPSDAVIEGYDRMRGRPRILPVVIALVTFVDLGS